MHRQSFRALACLLTLAAGSVTAQTGLPAPRYTITDLGTLPGGDHSGAYGINNKGQIAGWSDAGKDNIFESGTEDFLDPKFMTFIHNHAVIWDKGQLRDLGLLKGFPFGAAKAINDKGQAVGGPEVHYLPGIGGGMMTDETFLWQSGRITYFSIKTPPAHIDDLTGINSKGEMVGQGFPNNAHSRDPLLWFKGRVTDLGLMPGGREGIAKGINNKEEIVGWVTGNDPAQADGSEHDSRYNRAFLYRDGKMIDLDGHIFIDGRDRHSSSWAYGINDKGKIVGQFAGCAAVWENDNWRLLSPFKLLPEDGTNPSTAFAINDRGQIVGVGWKVSKFCAFIYQDGMFQFLDDLIPAGSGWVLTTARGINDRGQIVGSGQHDGKDRAFLLTPVKAP